MTILSPKLDGNKNNEEKAKRPAKARRAWTGLLLALPALACLASAPARAGNLQLAQNYERPPADYDNGGQGGGSGAAALLRVDRLENQVRSLNGQVEQLQFQLKRMEDQLRKFQMDVDMRLQDASGHAAPRPLPGAPQKRSDLPQTDAEQQTAINTTNVPAIGEEAALAPKVISPVGSAADGRRHDAFDPSAQPTAPGAPQELGSPASASRPVPKAVAETRAAARDPGAPLDLTPPLLRAQIAPAPAQPVARATTPVGASDPLEPAPPPPEASLQAAPQVQQAALQPAPQVLPQVLPTAPADLVKVDYDAATDQLKTQQYEAAELAFAAFVQKNPHSRLIAPAIFHLGETFYYRNRHREAAEQFLKIATDYSKSPVAPNAMVKLGVSLNALGAKEQACAFFSELPHKYPNAPASDKVEAAREAKKASC